MCIVAPDLREVEPRAHFCVPEACAVDEGAFVRRSRVWAGNDSFIEPREAAVSRQRDDDSRKVCLQDKRASQNAGNSLLYIRTLQ